MPEPPADDRSEPLVVVPDDASALFRDVEALRRERRAQARRARLRRWVLGRAGVGVGAPLVALVLLVVGVFAALPVVLHPDLTDDPAARPLARPAVSPGRVGGLLPDVELDTPAGLLSARDVARPGVLLLVPAGCRCDDAVVDAVQQSREFVRNIRVVVDGREPGAAAEADRLRGVGRGLVRSATDPGGVLAADYREQGLTAVLVADDGVVRDVLTDVHRGQRLEARLAVLHPPA